MILHLSDCFWQIEAQNFFSFFGLEQYKSW